MDRGARPQHRGVYGLPDALRDTDRGCKVTKFPSIYFSRSEFACKCGCGFDTVDAGLLSALDAIRAHFDRPVRVTSGCRCEAHNRAVGGSEKSQHKLGRAADIVVNSVPPELVAELARQMGIGGVGQYSHFTHIDTREGVSRWHG